MNTLQLTALRAAQALVTTLLLATAAGNALAESPIEPNEPFVSTRTRAEVQAELAAYRKSGVNPWAIAYNPLRHFNSHTTRAAVTAAYIASRHEVDAMNGEDSGSAYLARARTPRGADQLLAGEPRNPQ